MTFLTFAEQLWFSSCSRSGLEASPVSPEPKYDAAFARNVENAVFPAHLVERAISDNVEPLRANWPRWAA